MRVDQDEAAQERKEILAGVRAGVRDLRSDSFGSDLRCDVVVEGPQRAKSNGRGRRAEIWLTSPSLTISVPSPRTCARRVSAFRGARGKGRRGRCALMKPRLEPLGTVSFAQLTPLGTVRLLSNVPSTT